MYILNIKKIRYLQILFTLTFFLQITFELFFSGLFKINLEEPI